MKEYLVKDPQTGKYWASNSKNEYGFVCEIPEGADAYSSSGFFYKNGFSSRFQFSDWVKFNNKYCGNTVWQRQPTGTLVEYLNPNDWSLHVVNVDNDAAGEDWIKVPVGAECCNAGRIFYKDNGWTWHTGKEWRIAEHCYGNLPVRWKRHTQPEELPFIDDEHIVKNASHGHGTFSIVDDEPMGKKYDSNKPRMSLLPKGVLSSVVNVLEFGAKKYQEDNWQKVGNARTRYYDAMQRHIEAWWNGEKHDKETGEHHLAHAVCCAMFLMWFDGEQQ